MLFIIRAFVCLGVYPHPHTISIIEDPYSALYNEIIETEYEPDLSLEGKSLYSIFKQ